ncbi:MAG: HEAT repeat domain-containing protein [Deltaproteobacteria bacterium]|nr:HEAT repeat domain-containing protein [Deltaproteobacteria bacterium]
MNHAGDDSGIGSFGRTVSHRRLKAIIGTWLTAYDIDEIMERLSEIAPRRSINCLISCFCHIYPDAAWMARVAAGRITANLEQSDIESARVIMRRFMWMLNDESGGIGWGVPEAMAEAVACSLRLADEYASLLCSYLLPDMNYLEFPALQQGLLWGIGRVAETRPDLMAETGDALIGFMSSSDPVHRGYAALAAGRLGVGGKALEALTGDDSCIMIFMDEQLMETTVSGLAVAALSRLAVSR